MGSDTRKPLAAWTSARGTPRLMAIAVASTLLFSSYSEAVPTFDLASKALITTRFKSSGWNPGELVDLKWQDAQGATTVNLTADASGNIDFSSLNIDSRMATLQPGTQLTLEGVSSSVSITHALDPRWFAWVSPPGPNEGPLTSFITNTELAAAGFSPAFVALVDVSANAAILSSFSVFDFASDSITTTGFYNLLGGGPVFGTYRFAGTFSNLTDLDTGAILPPTFISEEFTGQIGEIVPEPSTMILLGGGLAAGVVRRRFETERAGPRATERRKITFEAGVPSVFVSCSSGVTDLEAQGFVQHVRAPQGPPPSERGTSCARYRLQLESREGLQREYRHRLHWDRSDLTDVDAGSRVHPNGKHEDVLNPAKLRADCCSTHRGEIDSFSLHVVANHVPEPSTYVLLSTGFLAVIARARRAKRRLGKDQEGRLGASHTRLEGPHLRRPAPALCWGVTQHGEVRSRRQSEKSRSCSYFNPLGG